MKNALILHGTGGNSLSNWFPWLKKELERKGFKVWVPNLPDAKFPDMDKYTDFIFSDWQFDSESVIVGHSSGAVEVLRILERLPENITINKAIMVAGFLNDLDRKDLIGMFKRSFNFEKIKQSAKEIILIHSDNDPSVPFENAQLLKKNTGGELVVMKGQGHFNLEVGEKYREFPEIIKLI